MNTKGIKFLAVLAVLAMAFAAFAVVSTYEADDADDIAVKVDKANLHDAAGKIADDKLYSEYSVTTSNATGYTNVTVKIRDLQAHENGAGNTGYWAGCSFIPAKDSGANNVKYKLALTKDALAEVAEWTSNGGLDIKANGTDDGFAAFLPANYTEFWLSLQWFDGEKSLGTATYCVKQDITVVHDADPTINVKGCYLTASNKDIGNSVTITKVESPSADLYAEYNIDAKLKYNDKTLKGLGMDCAADFQGYALIWQVTGLTAIENYIGATPAFGMSWNTGTDKTWYAAQASEKTDGELKYYDKETFAIYFAGDKTYATTSSAFLYFGPSAMKNSSDTGAAGKIKINFNVTFIKEDQIATTAEEVKEALVDSGEAQLTVGAEDVNLGDDIVVANDKTFIIQANAAGDVTGTITVGSGSEAQKVTIADFKGTVEFTKGSVKILGNPWTSGTVTLYDGDVVKVSGLIDGDVEFTYSGTTGSAKIVVEKNTTLTLDAQLIISKKNISVDIEGTVAGTGKIVTNFNGANDYVTVNVKDESVVKVGFGAAGDDTKRMKINVYSGSDFNGVGAITVAWSNIVGKDAASGTWKFTGGNTLELNNYNGTYNFKTFKGQIATIDLTGDNKITYVLPATYEAGSLFGGATPVGTIKTENNGSLVIDVDYSAVSYAEIKKEANVIITGAAEFKLDKVDVTIKASGINAAWEDTKNIALTAISYGATKFYMYDASLTIDAFSSYEAAKVYAVSGTGPLDISTSSLDIKSAGNGIKAYAVSASTIVGTLVSMVVTGTALDTNNQNVKFQLCTEVSIEAGIGIKTTSKVDVIDCLFVEIKAADKAFDIATAEVKNSIISVDGDAKITNLTLSNASVFGIDGLLDVSIFDIKTESALTVQDLKIAGASKVTDGTLDINGEAIIAVAGSLENNSVLINDGLIGIYGGFTNKGTVTNNGTFEVYKYKFAAGGALTVTAGEDASSDDYVKMQSITITGVEFNADGTADITANVIFKDKTHAAMGAIEFKGTLSPAIDGSYVLTLNNGTEEVAATATITVSYNASLTTGAGPNFGKSYTISVTGTITVAEASIYLENNDSTATAKALGDTIIDTSMVVSDVATFVTNSTATFNNNSVVVISSAVGGAEIIKGAYNGNLITNIEAVTISGAFKGDLTANGTGLVTISKTFSGNIVSKGSVTVAGTSAKMTGDITADKDVSASDIVGNINSKASVTVTKMTGTITVDRIAGDILAKNVTVKGESNVEIVYTSAYKRTADAKAGEETEYVAKMNVVGTAKGDGLVINLAAGADATASKDVVPGYFKIVSTAALDDNKTVQMTLTQGRIYVDSILVFESRYYLTIEKETTIEINKTAASLDVKNAALKVSKEATANFETGSAASVNYGKVLFIMSFETADGYTIYSDVAYALSNCDEGSTLTVGSNAAIGSSVAIKAGVNVIVDSVALDLDKYDISMGDGAKITLIGTGSLTFAASGFEVDDEEVKTLYYVNGTVVFDDNVMTFEDVRFTAPASITGIAAKDATPSKLNVALTYNEGTATLEAGVAAGAITLQNDIYELNEEDVMVFGTYVIAEDAVSEAAITDAALVDIDPEDDLYEPMTIVMVNGVMKVNANMTINGCYAGAGMLFLADGKVVSITDDASLAIEIGNDAGSFTFLSTDAEVEVTAVAEKSSVPAYVKVTGFVDEGVLSAKGNVATDGLLLNFGYDEDEEAVYGTLIVPEGATLSILKDTILVAGGFLMNAGTLNMREEGVTGYGNLIYEVAFLSEGYTVYSMLTSALEVAPAGTQIDIEDDLLIDEPTTIPAGVSLTIAAGHYLEIDDNTYLIIGEGITSLGADAILTGSIVLGLNAYVIDFAGSNSDIDVYIDEEMAHVAKENSFLVLDSLYATVYAEHDMQFGEGAGRIDISLVEPKISGYYFSEWQLQNGFAVVTSGASATKLSAGPFVAGTVASKVTTIFATVAGINYYVDGALVNTLDAPVKVDYGATITAKISNTSVYQGTPLVNGKSYIIVDDTTTKVTGSGVTPIPEPQPEPQPEPEVGGITLTDILLIVLVILIAVLVVIVVLRLNRS